MVESLISELVEAALEIALNDVDAVLDCSQHIGIIDFNANASYTAGVDQIFEQGAIAAAKVENAVARFNPGGNDIKIGTAQRVRHSLMFRR